MGQMGEPSVVFKLNRFHNHKQKAQIILNAARIPQRGGLRVYSLAVYKCLQDYGLDVEIVLPASVAGLECNKAHYVPGWLNSSARISLLRPVFSLLYMTFRFPAARSQRILSTTHHSLPFYRHQIITIHDLRPYFAPDSVTQWVQFHVLLKRAARRAQAIATVSEATKRALIDVYGIAAEKIWVIPNSVSFPLQGEACTQENDKPYLLMVGASQRHKNAMEVLYEHESWARDMRLVVVLEHSRYADKLKLTTNKLGIDGSVSFLHGIGDNELDELYRGCCAVVYPSVMEGFGIPPLEAMAHRKPVVVSDIEVFRELFAEAPYYVKLGDSASWRKVFADLLHGDITVREAHLEAGVKIAQYYTEERMCRALFDMLGAVWSIKAPTLRDKYIKVGG